MKAYNGRKGISPLILNLATHACEWSHSSPKSFTPGKTAPPPNTHLIADWLSSGVANSTVHKTNISCACQERNMEDMRTVYKMMTVKPHDKNVYEDLSTKGRTVSSGNKLQKLGLD
jgi:pentatricopeptide repeat protein